MTLQEFETYGALVAAPDWSEVEHRIRRARAAVAWMLKSYQTLRACDVFVRITVNGWRPCKPREWPPRSFCGLDHPFEHVEELMILHETSGGVSVSCGHATWSPCGGPCDE